MPVDPSIRPRTWIDPEPVPPDLQPLHEHKLLHALLYRRGLRHTEEAANFLQPAGPGEIDPGVLPDFDRAVDRIVSAVRSGERIGIFGDYDVDGTTATAILSLALEAAGAGDRTVVRLPTRIEGYGLSGSAIDAFDDAGVSLLIALDCGSADHGPAAYARALGMDVVIVDHHRLSDDGPNEAVVVSAYRPGFERLRELSAAGLTWLLVQGLERAGLTVAADGSAVAYLDLAALGLIGDVSPMTGASRTMTKAGLDLMAWRPRPAIRALAAAANVETDRIGSGDVSFRLVPRINAAGRMNDPMLALRLLLAPTLEEASVLVAELEALNGRRRMATEETTRHAEQLFTSRPGWADEPVVIVHAPGWHAGVVGIVAARLAERYDRPALVLVEEDGCLRGSIRAPEGFDVASALTACAPLLRSHGGHSLAGGLSLDRENLQPLRTMLAGVAADRRSAAAPTLQLDAELQERHLTLDIARLVRKLEPFGPGNDDPIFVLRGVRLHKYDAMGQQKQHLSLTIGNHRPIRAPFFNASARSRELVGVRAIDLAFTLREGDWNGPRVELIVKDFRPAAG